ncbi:tRNA(Ala)(adenine(37)) deaminase [Trifolium repens]|nr:tRNA(Ala)(adenine(37)) deaminase [Trifolium repens]
MGVCVNVGFHMNYINGYIIMRYVDFIRHLENELASPFLVNQPLFQDAPVPPKDFLQSESSANNLTCGGILYNYTLE